MDHVLPVILLKVGDLDIQIPQASQGLTDFPNSLNPGGLGQLNHLVKHLQGSA